MTAAQRQSGAMQDVFPLCRLPASEKQTKNGQYRDVSISYPSVYGRVIFRQTKKSLSLHRQNGQRKDLRALEHGIHNGILLQIVVELSDHAAGAKTGNART
jgi:hypothetical protein